MSSDMRVCPFCQMLIDIDACQKVMVITSTGKTSMYNSEDALQARITELEAENARLKEEIMGSLDNKTCSNCKYLDRQRQLCTNQMICLNYGFWKARF